MTEAPLLIVGAGPAGMNAAIAAAEHGAASTVVEEAFDTGGQIHRRPLRQDGVPAPHPDGEALRRRVGSLSHLVRVRTGAVAWGVFDGTRVAVTQDGRTDLLAPKALVLAPGAHEFVPPFPGWTLPGVMTPGAAQILVKTMGIAPGRRVVVAGTGPFLLAVAAQLVKADVQVVAVLEGTARLPWLTLPLHGWRTPGLLRDGFRYWATLAAHGVPLHHARMVVAAEGDGRVMTIAHAAVDREWRVDPARVERIECDALLVGYGFVPRVQLAQMAGCRLEYRPNVGGWVPVRDANLATSVAGVFAAGDGAGVAGAIVAAAEGRLAGLAAAVHAGALDPAVLARRRVPIERELRRLVPIRTALDRISALRSGLSALVQDDTVVCRCEEVTWRELRDAVGAGCLTYRSLKVATRVGMGACQGCFCWPSVARLVASARGSSPESVGPASARPPARPVTLGELAATGRGAG